MQCRARPQGRFIADGRVPFDERPDRLFRFEQRFPELIMLAICIGSNRLSSAASTSGGTTVRTWIIAA